jgi:hypothetical protein
MIVRAVGKSLAAGLAIAAIGAAVITCGGPPPSPGAPSGPGCGPFEYISGDACAPLHIGATAMDALAAGESNEGVPVDGGSGGGSDADGVPGTPTPGQDADASVAEDGPPDLDAFVTLTTGSLDALDLDVDCGGQIPVPVCVEYFAFLSSCLARDELDLACQSSLLEGPDADLQSIWQLCNDNLQRIEAACR